MSHFTNAQDSLRLTAMLLTLFLIPAISSAETLTSPDGQLKFQIKLRQAGPKSQLAYQVTTPEETIVADSTISFVRKDGVVIGDHLEQISVDPASSHDSTWNPVYGERSSIRDHYRTQTFRYRDTEANCPVVLEVRCYDSGVAFRTTLGDANGESLALAREQTEFRFAKDYPAWRTTSAQGTYDKVPLSQLGKNVERPLTIEAGKQVFAIGEAQLVDYAVMRLQTVAGGGSGVVSQLQSEIVGTTPLTTPWRFVMVADTPGQLLEANDLLLNLNEPCAIADTSWIKPGKVIREISLTTDGAKACIDFAAKNNFQYVEFDAGWYGHEYDDASDATTVTVDAKRSAGPLDLPGVIEYARQRDIGILVYVNRRALEKQLDEILPLYKKWGIAGVKYGFVQTGSQKWTAWLHEAIRKAADHQLMVDVHDEYRPTGYSRTYPNLMTQEGVRGDEATPSASLAITTIFTRNLAGAADHTICYYDPRVRANWSHAHQLAKAVCTYSPWQFMYWYDTPLSSLQDGKTTRNRIIDSPELTFFSEVPTVWDDTRVLNGVIGESVVTARRSGERWFIGAMNGDQPRTLNVPLDFLDSDRKYEATIYRDDPSLDGPTKVRIDRQIVDSNTVLEMELRPNGGEAVSLFPAK
ncbi:glycoside hydrolase family 97 N-terminal domain-containing protein [Bremerella sp. JC817]|uniref:glycoside hydrolase family 97 protein n=1 Tax=Bremerella sp. JC817 TaxID=3231756 RepID=UPI0034587D2E